MSSTTAPSIDRLREAVLAKAREEAERIVREAEERAKKIVEEVEERKRKEVEEARKKLFEEVGYEARIAEARIKASQMIARVKNEVMEELKKRVFEELEKLGVEERKKSLEKLFDEALASGVISGRFRVIVAPRDSGIAKELVIDRGLGDRVISISVKEDMMGGVILESEDGSTRVDNSYETRLEMVLRRRASEIAKELFGG